MSYTGGDKNGARVTTLLSGTPPLNVVGGKFIDARVHAFFDTFDMSSAAVAKSETLWMGYMPAGVVPMYGILNQTATLGTAVVSVGITGTTAKYRALLVKTSLVPEIFGVTAAIGVEITAAEEVLIVNDATAALPTSGTIVMGMFYGSES